MLPIKLFIIHGKLFLELAASLKKVLSSDVKRVEFRKGAVFGLPGHILTRLDS